MSNNEAPTDSLDLFLRDASRRPLLTAAQEVKLTKLVERGDAGARQTMIESNLRLVVSIAKNYRHRAALPRPDPEAIGLNRAAESSTGGRATGSRPMPTGGFGRRSRARSQIRRR
jgi:hypothetical protein